MLTVSTRVSRAVGVFPLRNHLHVSQAHPRCCPRWTYPVSDSAQPSITWRLLPDRSKHLGLGQVRDILGDLEFTESRPSTGVYDSLLDLRAVKGLLLL